MEQNNESGSGVGAGVYFAVALVLIGIGGGVYWFMSNKSKGSPKGDKGDGGLSDKLKVPDDTAKLVPGAKTGSPGNDYVSGEAIDKRNSRNYDPYTDTTPNSDYTQAIMDNLGYTPSFSILDSPKKRASKRNDAKIKTDAVEKYVRGFLKGMNLAPRADYVAIFIPYIKEYLNNPAKLGYDVVAKGQLLK